MDCTESKQKSVAMKRLKIIAAPLIFALILTGVVQLLGFSANSAKAFSVGAWLMAVDIVFITLLAQIGLASVAAEAVKFAKTQMVFLGTVKFLMLGGVLYWCLVQQKMSGLFLASGALVVLIFVSSLVMAKKIS